MPLPTGGPWPPPAFARVHARLEEWSAWYSGEADALSRIYGGTLGRDPEDPHDRAGLLINRPAQYRGGIVGRVARFFWGTPVAVGEKRHKLHVPIAADIAATSADLLFGELPAIRFAQSKLQDAFDELADEADLHATLLEAAELTAALGGGYLRVCWDADVADHPWLAPMHADAAIPEWTWGKLTAATFWRQLEGPDTPTNRRGPVIRHLERHEPGVILHGLFEGTADQLGRPIPLTEHAATRELAGIVNEESAIPTGTDRLTVVYVPNMRPNRTWRADPANTNLGRSDYSGVEPIMDSLDETYTSWMRDIRLAKGRLLVPDVYLQSLGKGKGAWFDAEQEVFTGLDMLPKPDAASNGITINQFKIRVTEHADTASNLIAQILRGSGYNTQTFGETVDGAAAATATEVNARDHRTNTTRTRKIGYFRSQLRSILETLMAVNAAQFGGPAAARPTIEWPDAVAPDPNAIAQTAQLLRAANAASTDTLVRLVHPDWDDQQVDEEVERIAHDSDPVMPDPADDPATGRELPPPATGGVPVDGVPVDELPVDGAPAGQ